MLARPRSVSSSRVRWPALHSAMARLTETLVLPTPHLPLATAITLTGAARSGAGAGADAWTETCAGTDISADDGMAVRGGQGVDGSTGHRSDEGSVGQEDG